MMIYTKISGGKLVFSERESITFFIKNNPEKICKKWVPHVLTEELGQKRVDISCKF